MASQFSLAGKLIIFSVGVIVIDASVFLILGHASKIFSIPKILGIFAGFRILLT
jgi:hypothetical protein